MDMDEDFEPGTPPDISKAADAAALSLLPPKSKEKYEAQYQLFMEYRAEKKIDSFSERVLLAYFAHLAKTLKSSTLWAKYSMLKATLSVTQDIDISKFMKLKAFLKQQGDGYVPKKSSVFNQDQIDTFICEAPDGQYLLVKVAVILAIGGRCCRNDLSNLKTNDVADLGRRLLVTIPVSKTVSKPRSFIVNETYYPVCNKYMALRPTSLTNKKFFFNIRHGRPVRQVVGIHSFGRMPQVVARYLGLPDPQTYTGHSLKRSSENILTDRKRWSNSTSVVERYELCQNKIETSNQLQSPEVTGDSDNNENNQMAANQPSTSSSKAQEVVKREFEFVGTYDLNDFNDLESKPDISMESSNVQFLPSLYIKVENPDFEENTFDDMSMDHLDATIEEPTSPIDTKPNIECLETEHATLTVEHRPTSLSVKAQASNGEVREDTQSNSSSCQNKFQQFAMSIASRLGNMPSLSALRIQAKIEQLLIEEEAHNS